MRIALGADHSGFELKQHLAARLAQQGHAVEDCGTHDPKPCDYPKIAAAVAGAIAAGRAERGIIVDGAGIGSAMAANKIRGVRAALCYDLSSARNAREHNDANVLTLGSRLIGVGLAEQIVDVFLATACGEERHLKRVAMIAALEGGVRPSAVGATEVANRDELSPEDIERIATRLAALMAVSGGTAAACACCGPTCSGHCAQQNPQRVRELLEMGAGRIAGGLGGGPIPRDLAAFIDHTALKPETTADEIRRLCAEAAEHGFASVCVNPCWVRLAADRLKGSAVKVCSVVGFPLGATTTATKALETRQAIREGAREIDMVINVGALRGRDDETVYRDIRAVVEACEDGGAICKVIIEAALLSDEEKTRACQAAKRARADFVKTSTGFGPGGATPHDVALMSQAVAGTGMGVKAAGGIRNFEDAKKMIEAGATRIGASAGVRIVKEAVGGAGPAPAKAEKY